jgi:hypothetical protein
VGKTEADSRYPASPRARGVTLKLLIDECLHTSLVELAHAAGYVADHVIFHHYGPTERRARRAVPLRVGVQVPH